MAEQHQVGVVGLFDEPQALVAAAERVRDDGWTVWDCHTPFPVHGLDQAMGVRPSRLPALAITVGVIGAAVGLGMQWWMSAVDYPVRIGGKPLFSWPAFLPITFEFFVLFTALATTLLATRFCKLWRWHSPLHDTGIAHEVTTTRFALVLSAEDERYEAASAIALLAQAGCEDVRPLMEDADDGRTL